MTETTKIGLEIEPPQKECDDKKCPFHGKINVKEEEKEGKVIKKDMHNTATIEWKRKYHIPKYERYEIRTSKIRVHNPECINAEVGDKVKAVKTKPLSKTKNFVIVEKIEENQ